MTNSEAIETLKANYPDACYEQLREAVDKAIKALEKEVIKAALTIDPVRHGKWISVPHKKARICSVCECDEPYKFADEDANVFDYCPHCGTKMDAKEVWTYFD